MAAVDDEESPDELLTRARRIANFRGLWPAEFSPDQIAALMAKGWSGFHLQARRDKQKLVSYAIAEGLLLARTEKHTKPVRTITKYGYDEFGVRGSFFKEFRETNTTRRYIGAGDCADWLKSRGIQANEYITEWLRVRGINFSQWQTRQENDTLPESTNCTKQDKLMQEKCRAAIRKVWERDQNLTITGKNNAMADQPELAQFLAPDPDSKKPMRSVQWIQDRAREVSKEIRKISQAGRPRTRA